MTEIEIERKIVNVSGIEKGNENGIGKENGKGKETENVIGNVKENDCKSEKETENEINETGQGLKNLLERRRSQLPRPFKGKRIR